MPKPEDSYFVEHRLTPEGVLVAGDTFAMPVLPPAQRVTWVRQRGRITKVIPFTHRPTWILGSSGDFWITQGDGKYAIQRITLSGDSVLAIERSHTPIAIPDSIREQSIREFQPEGTTAQGGFDADQVPRVYPPFSRFAEAADGTLWVWSYREDGLVGLDVFSADGAYLGMVDVPPGFEKMSIDYITRDYMYGTVRDELDVPYAVRLAIRRPQQ